MIAVGKGVLKANNSTMLMKTGSPFKLTGDWARSRCIKVFRMNDRKGGEPLEENLIFQKKISSLVVEHSIPKKLIKSLDQVPLSCVTLGEYIFDVRSAKTVPVKGIDDKRQIIATFSLSISGEFLPI